MRVLSLYFLNTDVFKIYEVPISLCGSKVAGPENYYCVLPILMYEISVTVYGRNKVVFRNSIYTELSVGYMAV